jgi:hypothetical protein
MESTKIIQTGSRDLGRELLADALVRNRVVP